jgi:DNA-binding PadR family transcriptional regulator
MAQNAPSPQPVLLGFLMDGPCHAYGLHQAFERELGRVWHLGRSKLYAQLKQLAQAGQVTAQTELQSNRPPRQVYHLTPAGREAFMEWLHQPTLHLRYVRLEFLARLYFFRRLELEGLEALVARQKALLQVRIAAFDAAAADSDDEFERLVFTFRQGQMAAVIRWLDQCQKASS